MAFMTTMHTEDVALFSNPPHNTAEDKFLGHNITHLMLILVKKDIIPYILIYLVMQLNI